MKPRAIRSNPARLPHLAARAGAALAAAASLCWGAAARAGDLETVNLLNQQQFRLLSEDVAAAAAFKPLIPAEATGITGFDIGLATYGTQVKNKAEYELATGGDDAPGTLTQVSLRGNKGLPFDFDIGAHFSQVLDSNIRVAGADLRWAAVLGGTFTPAVSLRLGISNISGVDQMDLDTVSFDVSVSKGFTFVTPYAGLGRVQVKAQPNGIGTLEEEKFGLSRLFVGANVALGLTNFIIEADRTGDSTGVGLKFGVRF